MTRCILPFLYENSVKDWEIRKYAKVYIPLSCIWFGTYPAEYLDEALQERAHTVNVLSSKVSK